MHRALGGFDYGPNKSVTAWPLVTLPVARVATRCSAPRVFQDGSTAPLASVRTLPLSRVRMSMQASSFRLGSASSSTLLFCQVTFPLPSITLDVNRLFWCGPRCTLFRLLLVARTPILVDRPSAFPPFAPFTLSLRPSAKASLSLRMRFRPVFAVSVRFRSSIVLPSICARRLCKHAGDTILQEYMDGHLNIG